MSKRLDKAVDIIRRAHRYVGMVRSDDVDGDDPIYAFLDEMEFFLRDEAKAELERLTDVERLLLKQTALLREMHRKAVAEIVRLKKDTHQSPALPFGTAAGCMCPSGANLSCQNSFCPRRNPPNLTWKDHT